MKITYSILGLAAGAAMLLAIGCGKEQPPSAETPKSASPTASETQPAAEAARAAAEQVKSAATAAVEQAAKTVTSEAQKAVESATATAQQAQPTVAAATEQGVKSAAAQTDTTAEAASSQVQGLIDKAKGLVSDEKYQEALNTVQQLTNMKLTPEQQKLVDDLKAQIQTALAKAAWTNAASALGNILGGKK